MATMLNIKRCWFHAGASYAHYDIPVQRQAEIKSRCVVVSSRDILRIAKGETLTNAPTSGIVET